MTRVMIGPMILFAAVVSSGGQPALAVLTRSSAFQPVSGATARATASVRIVSGVKFGPSHSGDVSNAIRRPARLTDQAGQAQPAELLEFQ